MRLAFPRLAPTLFQPLFSIKTQLEAGPLGVPLAELIWTRIAQINGCHGCVAMHTKALLAAGDTDERVRALAAWRTSPLFDARERCALAYAEALTDVKTEGAPDTVYEPLKEHFDDQAIIHLTYAIALLNAFTRINIALG